MDFEIKMAVIKTVINTEVTPPCTIEVGDIFPKESLNADVLCCLLVGVTRRVTGMDLEKRDCSCRPILPFLSIHDS